MEQIMKKSLVFIFVLTLPLFSQQNEKGRINLIFNDEKIDLPVNLVVIRKENRIFINVRAEQRNDKFLQMVSLELVMRQLHPDSLEDEGIQFDIMTKNLLESSGKDLSFRIPQFARYSSYNKNQRVTWENISFGLKIGIKNLVYIENRLKITGVFRAEFRSIESKDPMIPIAEIKDGKFEIII